MLTKTNLYIAVKDEIKKMRNTTKFSELEKEIPAIKKISIKTDETGYFLQETLRFYSISATLLANGYELDTNATTDERYQTHLWIRSLLEAFFVISYIFDDPLQTSSRYEKLTNEFKKQYAKLMSDLNNSQYPWSKTGTNYSIQLEPSSSTWKDLPGLPDIKSMLCSMKNYNGNKMDYLYTIYRVASFDTHGRSLSVLFQSSFKKQCIFPIIKIRYAIEIMADYYTILLNDLRKKGKI